MFLHLTISLTYSQNPFYAIITTISYLLLTFIELSSIHGEVLNYVWKSAPDIRYLLVLIILLFILLYLSYQLPLFYFFTCIYHLRHYLLSVVSITPD
jgi:hypothetical protein